MLFIALFLSAALFFDGDIMSDIACHNLSDMSLLRSPVRTFECHAVSGSIDILEPFYFTVVVDLDKSRFIERQIGSSKDIMSVSGGNEHRKVTL